MKHSSKVTSTSVWDLLQDALNDAPKPRPADSVTAEEFAAKAGYSRSHARDLLSHNPRLRSVPYLTDNHKIGKCYVAL